MFAGRRFEHGFEQRLQSLDSSSLIEQALQGGMGSQQVARAAGIQRMK